MASDFLRGTRTYLIGPMDRAKDGGKQWREKLTPFLRKIGVIVMDPCDKPIQIGAESDEFRSNIAKWKNSGEYDKIKETVRIIRQIDLRMTDISDFVIVYIDVDVHCCGTYEELFWANRLKRPTLIVCKQGKRNCPGWLFGTVPHQHIFSDFGELKLYLKKINNEGPEDKDKRWILFNYQSMQEQIEQLRKEEKEDEKITNTPIRNILMRVQRFFRRDSS